MRARRLSVVLAGLLLVIGCGGKHAGGKGGSVGSVAGTGGSATGGTGGGATAGTGGDATAGTDGGSGGSGGSAGTGGRPVVGANARAAIEVCAWTTGCFNTEDAMAGA